MATHENRPVQIEYLDAETIEQMQSDEEKAFRDFRNSFTGDEMGILRVSRLKVGKFTKSLQNLKGAHCFSCPIDQYEYDELMEVLRERYGGGLYRLVGIQKGHQGTKFNKLVEIAQTERLESDGAPEQKEGMGAVMDTVNEMLADAQERTERMLERFAPQAQVTADPFAMFSKTVELLGTMGVLGNKRESDGIGELRKFLEMKTLVQELGGGEESGAGANFYSMMTKTLETFGGPLLMAVQAGAKAGALSPNPAAMTPQPRALEAAPMRATPETPPQPTEGQMTQIKEMQRIVGILLMNAKAGVSAVDFAGIVLDQTPDEQLDTLHGQASAPDYISKLEKINPDVANYRGWFQALREEIVRLLDEMLEPEPGEVIDADLQPDSDGHIVEPSTGAVTGDKNLKAVPDAPIERTPTTEPKPETGGNAEHVNGDPERSAGDTPNP